MGRLIKRESTHYGFYFGTLKIRLITGENFLCGDFLSGLYCIFELHILYFYELFHTVLSLLLNFQSPESIHIWVSMYVLIDVCVWAIPTMSAIRWRTGLWQ